jgi:RNA polymerase sigma factor (sigma-70 family)
MDEDLAKDVTQESYLKLWENLSKVEMDKAKSWLFTTAYRLTLHHIRDTKVIDKTAAFPEYSVETNHTDLQKILNEALILLNETQRSIVLLKDYEGYNYAEIGEMLNLNESQVKVYLFRARQKLREYIVDLKLVI